MKHNKTKEQLLELGYTYQPLFASNYPCCNKVLEFSKLEIYAWLDGSYDIQVPDLCHKGALSNLILFYENNKDKVVKSIFTPDYHHLTVYYNKITNEFKLSKDVNYLRIVLIPEDMDELINELNVLNSKF